MTNKTIFTFFIFTLIFATLHAKETRVQRGFTVTTIALDAQKERFPNEYAQEENNTTMQGGETEEN